MAHAHHELPTDDKNEIMELIYKDHQAGKFNPQNLRPVAITDVQGTEFFPWYNNTWEGYFLTVQYANGLFELWFAVDLHGGDCDDRWFLERIGE